MQNTRDIMPIVDVYHELGNIVNQCNNDEKLEQYKDIAEKQLMEVHEMLHIVHFLNKQWLK